MEPLRPGENPRRTLRHHRERGAQRYEITYESIAQATGLALSSVRTNYPDLRRALEEPDLATLAAFVLSKLGRRSHRLTPAEEQAVVGDLAAWSNRFPRFDLWRCAFPTCRAVLFSAGCCEKHGGGEAQLAFDDELHFMVRVGQKLRPLHHVLLEFPAGAVHHEDHNRWNNRRDNLRVTPLGAPLSPRTTRTL